MPRRIMLAATLTLLSAFVRSHTAVDARPVRVDHLTHHVTLMLDWYPNSDHGGIFSAMEKGFFARRGISVSAQVPSDTSAQISLVAAGRADFGVSYESDLLAARAHHIPVQSVMCIMQHPLNTVMTLRSSGITRPRQLAGHTLGVAGSPSDVPIVSAMMARDGSSIKKTRIVNVGYNLLSTLLARKVDAVVGVYWTWEAIQARMHGQPVNVMRVERWGVPNYCELVLVANERTIRTEQSLVRGTVQALQQGYAFAETHPQEAWTALHARDQTLKPGLVLPSLRLLRAAVLDAPTIGYHSPSQWQRYAGWLTTRGVIGRGVDARKSFTNRFLQPRIK